jgi:hypothetical protein
MLLSVQEAIVTHVFTERGYRRRAGAGRPMGRGGARPTHASYEEVTRIDS